MRFLFHTSLRSALTVQAGFVIFLAVFICAASLLIFSAEEDREDLDASLLHDTQTIGRFLEGQRPEEETSNLLRMLLAAEPGRRMAEVRLSSGQIVDIPARADGPILIDEFTPAPTAPQFQSSELNGNTVRIVHASVGGQLVAVASRPPSLAEVLANVLVLYGVLTVVLILIVFTGGRWLANRALAPVLEIADSAERITSFDITHRLPVNQPDRELHRLTSILNDMLDRLQASFDLVRRFTADAAHEIKTPLAIIHGHLEATLRNQELAEREENTLLLTLREVERMNRLVDGLLLLSRSDAGRLDLEFKTLDWSALAAELLHDAEILCAPLGLVLHTSIAPGVIVFADREYLRQVLLNLLDNACKYNRIGGRVQITLTDNPPRFEIGNTGEPIPSDVIPFVFERFQRADQSRTRGVNESRTGLGLGLSICNEIIHAHGGQINIVQSQEDWTVFAVTLFTQKA